MSALGKTVLVVDDSVVMRKLVTAALAGMGCDIVEATNGYEGIQLFNHYDVALVITDLVMPETGGIELIESIRAHASRSDVPVIVLSSQVAGDLVDRAFAFGVKACLKKPIKRAVLASAVAFLLAPAREAPRAPSFRDPVVSLPSIPPHEA